MEIDNKEKVSSYKKTDHTGSYDNWEVYFGITMNIIQLEADYKRM
jgi:hypothetical protein